MLKYISPLLAVLFCGSTLAENIALITKYGRGVNGYFSSPEQVKARDYWEQYFSIDLSDPATIPLADQVAYAAGTETGRIEVPSDYTPDRPVGIYVHINPGDGTNIPSHLLPFLEDSYLSQIEGLTPCYAIPGWSCDFSANRYRLPTEAEWEWAARGGLSAQRFPRGLTIDHDDANYLGGGYPYDTNGYPSPKHHPVHNDFRKPYTSPIGAFAANHHGLCGMAGNAWEYCNDWYSDSYYAASPQDNPTGPVTGSLRVNRGGGWDSPTPEAQGCRQGLEGPGGQHHQSRVRGGFPPGPPPGAGPRR